MDSLFAFSFMWSIGGSITDEGEGYAKMDSFMRAHRAFSQVRACPDVHRRAHRTAGYTRARMPPPS